MRCRGARQTTPSRWNGDADGAHRDHRLPRPATECVLVLPFRPTFRLKGRPGAAARQPAPVQESRAFPTIPVSTTPYHAFNVKIERENGAPLRNTELAAYFPLLRPHPAKTPDPRSRNKAAGTLAYPHAEELRPAIINDGGEAVRMRACIKQRLRPPRAGQTLRAAYRFLTADYYPGDG